MGTRNTTTAVFPWIVPLLVLCLVPAAPVPAQSGATQIAPSQHELTLAAEASLAVGPYPDVPVYDYPRGPGLLIRYTFRPPFGVSSTGVELVRPGITLVARGAVAGARAIEPVFGALVLLMPSIEAGTSLALGRALDVGLSVDVTGGGGLYLATYGFTDTSLHRVRPMASAHLTLRTLDRDVGLSAAAGWIAFADRELRHFVSVRAAIEFFLTPSPDVIRTREAIR